MEMKISTSEREELRKLQRILYGSSNYTRVTYLLVLDKNYLPSAISVCLSIEYASQRVMDLLNRIGFTSKKTTEVLCKADASLQKAFVEELAETLAQMEEDSVVYYAYATHNSRSTYAWIETGKRMEQPTVNGWNRINGLLNTHDVTDVIAIDCGSVNAQSTKELYPAALEKHLDAPAIYIILNNACYYHNKNLKEWIEGTKIKRIFLPPYSSNLNLIEWLWKILRKKVINTVGYRSKEEFWKTIKRFFDNIETFKEELKALLTLNFRLSN